MCLIMIGDTMGVRAKMPRTKKYTESKRLMFSLEKKVKKRYNPKRVHDGEHGCVLLSNCFRLFAGPGASFLVLFVGLDRSEAAKKDWQQRHDE